MRAFRLDERHFDQGDVVKYRGDCAEMLSAKERVVEDALRAYAPGLAETRLRAQYFYLDENYAIRMAKLDRTYRTGPPRSLYEVEIAECDILHKGDLNHYSAAQEAVEASRPLQPHVAGYWSGLPAGAPWTGPRYEVLALQAVVVRKL